MKHLIFIGVLFLLGSCSMQRYYFSKRIPVISEKISPPEFFTREENTAELSVLKPINEHELSFELVYIDTVNVNQPAEVIVVDTLPELDRYLDTVPNPEKTRRDPTEHNECRCFAKSLIISGSILSIMGVLTFFSWTTLGIGALVIGLLMLITGIILKRQ